MNYKSEQLGIVKGVGNNHMQMISMIDLQVGDIIEFSDEILQHSHCLVHSKDIHQVKIVHKLCDVEAFALETPAGTYMALARVTYKGRIHMAYSE